LAGEMKYSRKTYPQYDFAHHKSHINLLSGRTRAAGMPLPVIQHEELNVPDWKGTNLTGETRDACNILDG
jgi:hypothetical protein